MSSIAACPRCTSSLQIPLGAFAESKVRCPVCGAEFAVSDAPVQALPEAEVIAAEPEEERKLTVSVEPDAAAKATVVADDEKAKPDESLDSWEQLRSELSSQAAEKAEEVEEVATQTDERLAELKAKLEKPTLSSLIGKSDADEDGEEDAAEQTEQKFVPHEWEQVPTASESSKKPEPAPTSSKRSLEDMLAEFRKPVEAEPVQRESADSPGDVIDEVETNLAPKAENIEAEGDESSRVEPASLFQSRLDLPDEAEATAGTSHYSPEKQPRESEQFDQSLERTMRSLQHETAAADESEPSEDPEESFYPLPASPPMEPEVAYEDSWQKAQSNEPLDLKLDTASQQSSLKPLAGVVAGGVLGSIAIAYSLLWIVGPKADLLKMASWAPEAILPASLRDKNETQSVDEYLAGAMPLKPEGDTQSTEVPIDNDVAPASAVTLAESSGSDSQASEVQASELLRAGELKALLVDPRTVTTDELSAAVAEARAALPELLTGSLSDADSIARKGSAYKSFAKLAECVALAGASDSSEQATVNSDFVLELTEGKKLLRRAISDQYERDEVSQIAARWMEYTKRPSSGIAFVGTVIDVRAVGALTEYLIEIRWQDEQLAVPVLMPRLRYTTGDQIGVVGIVAVSPRESLRGYEGDAPQTILADDSFPLEE